ncbi:suppressor of tumorigenicity 14 protein-like [Tropilaelaps mercedesae]|uniref:Suppressor of tumorigenicity 14 protein-like n=1 Tax=Tropilaelaps mercedesae TaxID=418985 RepID=A0A1V9XIN7_9ACAR|nr:suppressor of tumorigenicity 14 protein-like [Tropilaelaps mercedesae]
MGTQVSWSHADGLGWPNRSTGHRAGRTRTGRRFAAAVTRNVLRRLIWRQLIAPLVLILLLNPHANDTHAGVHAGPPSCFMEFDSTASKQGNFSSPAYPNNYPENIECYYTFKVTSTSPHLTSVVSREVDTNLPKGVSLP